MRAMGALRKAGVWLGLVEEEDEVEPGYDEFAEDEFTPVRPRSVSRSATRPAEPVTERDPRPRQFEVDRGRAAEEPGRDRTDRADRGDRSERGDRTDRMDRTERGSVRPLARPTSNPASVQTVSTVSFPGDRRESSWPSQDNLALAPQTQLRERAVVPDEPARRYQITTLHPTTFREARAIGEHFREGVPVIINLTDMAESDARRLVDFAAGLAFGLQGTIERVTNRVFLISPADVQVTAEDKAKIAEGGFFDQS
jgi:cell division inhibitor SepF